MTVNVPIWIGALYSAVLIAAAFGVGVANFRAGDRKAQADVAKSQSNAITALQAELSVVKDANHRLEVEVASISAERNQLLQRISDLADLANGWKLLTAGLDALNKVASAAPDWQRQAEQEHKAMISALTDLATAIRTLPRTRR